MSVGVCKIVEIGKGFQEVCSFEQRILTNGVGSLTIRGMHSIAPTSGFTFVHYRLILGLMPY